MKRQLTSLFFRTDFNLSQYLGEVINKKPRKALAVETKGKFFQFRNVKEEGQDIYGRLCHIRVKGRPDSSTPDSSEENKIPGGVIEAACFRYHKGKRVLLMQQNSHVCAAESSLRATFIKVLNHINKDGNIPDKGFFIGIILEKEALRKILENREGLTKYVLPLDQNDVLEVLQKKITRLEIFHQKDLNAIKDSALHVKFFVESESKERMVEQIVRSIEESKDEENGSAFHIKGQPPLIIGDFVRKERTVYEIPEDASYEAKYRAIYRSLAGIDVSNVR